MPEETVVAAAAAAVVPSPTVTPDSTFFVAGFLAGPPGWMVWVVSALALLGFIALPQLVWVQPKLLVEFTTTDLVTEYVLSMALRNPPIVLRWQQLMMVRRMSVEEVVAFVAVSEAAGRHIFAGVVRFEDGSQKTNVAASFIPTSVPLVHLVSGSSSADLVAGVAPFPLGAGIYDMEIGISGSEKQTHRKRFVVDVNASRLYWD